VTARYVYGSRSHVPDYVVKGDVTYRLVTDHLGSVRMAVDAASGAVAAWREYDAWGNVTDSLNAGFVTLGYAGGIVDDSTGLVRFGARDYDPAIGRWTSKDPIDFEGGDENLYAYAASSPIVLIDPTGLSAESFVEGAASSLLGAVATTAVLAGIAAIGPELAAVSLAVAAGGAAVFTSIYAYNLARALLDPCKDWDEIHRLLGQGMGAGIFAAGAGPKGFIFGRGGSPHGRGEMGPGVLNGRPDIRLGWSWNGPRQRLEFGYHGGTKGGARPPWHRTNWWWL
jgi:RHS repeat-associated protein